MFAELLLMAAAINEQKQIIIYEENSFSFIEGKKNPNDIIIDGEIYARNVIMTTTGECPQGVFRFGYRVKAKLGGKRPNPPAPRVIELSHNGKSLPKSEIAVLENFIGDRNILGADISKCGNRYMNKPRMVAYITFQKRSNDPNDLSELTAFVIENGKVYTEKMYRAKGGSLR